MVICTQSSTLTSGNAWETLVPSEGAETGKSLELLDRPAGGGGG